MIYYWKKIIRERRCGEASQYIILYKSQGVCMCVCKKRKTRNIIKQDLYIVTVKVEQGMERGKGGGE